MSDVRVVTDAGGVPRDVVLSRAALRRGEQALAAELLARCQEAGARVRAERAARLLAAGVAPRTLARLGLDAPAAPPPTDPGEPTSWLGRT